MLCAFDTLEKSGESGPCDLEECSPQVGSKNKRKHDLHGNGAPQEKRQAGGAEYK